MFWASIAYYTMNTLINSQSYYAKLINLSGKQRMLSQKSAFFVHRYQLNKDQENLYQIQLILDEIKINHDYITQNLSQNAKELYFNEPSNIDSKMTQYTSLLQNFVDNPNLVNLDDIYLQSQDILIYLDMAVGIFQKESEEKTKELQQRELYIFIGTILTILFEAHFFAKPVIDTVRMKFQDFYERLRQKDKLIELQSKFFNNAHEGIVITDKNNKIIDLNPAFESVTGYSKDELIGKNPSILKSGEHNEIFYKSMWDNLNNNGSYKGEIINKKKSGQHYVQNVSIFTLKNEQNITENYFALVSDVTEKHLSQQKLYHYANFDSLTNLPNRHFFYEKLKATIANSKRHNNKFALIYIDLDDFKKINDSLGHDYGDELLVQFAKIIGHILRENDIFARVGGDEFVIIMDNLKDITSITKLFERLLNQISKPINIKNNHTYNISASFGISIYPDDSTQVEELIKFADLAMYESKNLGKNRYTFYNNLLEQRLLKDIQLEKDILNALANDEFIVYLQPKINPKTNQISGAEALVRWQKGDTLIFPDQFIPFCEKSDLIVKLGDKVVAQVMEIFKRWSTMEKYKDLSLSFNLSSKQIYNSTILEVFQNHQELLKKNKGYLIAEITEYSLIEDFEVMKNFLENLRELNIKIAIDDFGTGYSSLQSLKNLPLDYLKVDKGFTLNIFKNPKDMAVSKTIINLAHNLNLETIIEGVETKEHVDFAIENRCTYAQGYFYSKAIPVEKFEDKVI